MVGEVMTDLATITDIDGAPPIDTEAEMVDLVSRHPLAFSQGFSEGLGAVSTLYADEPESDRSLAYDLGRVCREALHESLSTLHGGGNE